jgi:hypothetical protein
LTAGWAFYFRLTGTGGFKSNQLPILIFPRGGGRKKLPELKKSLLTSVLLKGDFLSFEKEGSVLSLAEGSGGFGQIPLPSFNAWNQSWSCLRPVTPA